MYQTSTFKHINYLQLFLFPLELSVIVSLSTWILMRLAILVDTAGLLDFWLVFIDVTKYSLILTWVLKIISYILIYFFCCSGQDLYPSFTTLCSGILPECYRSCRLWQAHCSIWAWWSQLPALWLQPRRWWAWVHCGCLQPQWAVCCHRQFWQVRVSALRICCWAEVSSFCLWRSCWFTLLCI